MKTVVITSWVVALGLGVLQPGVAGPICPGNGDVNGDGALDLSDGIYLLNFIFLGGPEPVLFCIAAGPKDAGCTVDNGDVNGDGGMDLSDPIYSLAFSFQGGAAPVPICPDLQLDPIPAYLEQVDISRLSGVATDLVVLYGPRDSSHFSPFVDGNCTFSSTIHPKNNLDMACDYVQSIFESLEYTAETEAVTLSGGQAAYNVTATRVGSVEANVFIEVGAHIDTVSSSPGAGDNASGVAAVIELARVLRDYPSRHSIRFIAYVGEESGLTGSSQHVDGVLARGEEIKAGLILDGIGWSEIAPEHMNCIWANGDADTLKIANMCDVVRTEYDIDINWRLCTPSGQSSDNVSYWNRGFPAVLSIGGLPYTAPHYHACGDTMATVDMENVFKTTLQNLAVLMKLDAECEVEIAWQQTDWVGGAGQVIWADETRYHSASGVHNDISGQLSLESTAGGDVLFADDFTRPPDAADPLLPWITELGTWEVADGILTTLFPPQGYSLVYADAIWTDSTIEGRIQLPPGGYAACISGRVDPETGSQYAACVYPEGLLRLINLDNWTDWSWQLIQIVDIPPAGTAWHTLKLDLRGNQIRVYYDGSLVIDAMDNSYASGGVSLFTWTPPGYSASYGAAFDDLVVRTPTEYSCCGTLLSSAFDGGAGVDWQAISLDAATGGSTDVVLRYRTADQAHLLPTAAWSAYAMGNPTVMSEDKRWIQYEMELTSTDSETTPVIYDIGFQATQ